MKGITACRQMPKRVEARSNKEQWSLFLKGFFTLSCPIIISKSDLLLLLYLLQLQRCAQRFSSILSSSCHLWYWWTLKEFPISHNLSQLLTKSKVGKLYVRLLVSTIFCLGFCEFLGVFPTLFLFSNLCFFRTLFWKCIDWGVKKHKCLEPMKSTQNLEMGMIFLV